MKKISLFFLTLTLSLLLLPGWFIKKAAMCLA